VCSGESVSLVCSGESVSLVCSGESVSLVCSGESVSLVCSGESVSSQLFAGMKGQVGTRGSTAHARPDVLCRP
jgi:hypothetical protein